jgi:hypothetical protein
VSVSEPAVAKQRGYGEARGVSAASPAVASERDNRQNRPVDLLIDVVGSVGAALLLVAYGLTSTGRLPSEGGRFQLLNLMGALALTANSAYHGAWPSAGLNIVWIVIGVAALVRGHRKPASSDPA